MKKFKILSLVLILLLAASILPAPALAVDGPELLSNAAILVNAESGEVYFEKNANERIQPASTTKLVTALLVVEAVERGDIGLSDEVTASDSSLYNLEYDSSNADPQIKPGETMSVQDLLYCTMLVSANEACNILAEYLSGSVSSFVDAMNARAQELGCEGTHFTNVNGLEDPDHYSTAADFARFACAAMEHDLFEQICGTQSYTVPATNMAGERSLKNTNLLLDENSEFHYSYADGIKTGYFSAAGYCLVSSAEKDDMRVIGVVMGGPSTNDQFRDSITLYNWMFDNFEMRQVLSSTETRITVPVSMGTSETVGVRAEDAVSVILPRDYDISKVSYQYILYHEQTGEELTAPVNAGETLGEITVVETDGSGNVTRTFGSSYLVAASSVAMSRTDYVQSELEELFSAPIVRKAVTILIVLLAVYFLLVTIYLIQRLRHMASLRRARRDRARRMTEAEAEWLSFPDEEEREPSIEYFGEEDEEPASLEEKAPPAPERPAPARRDFDDDFFDSFFES